MPMQARNHAVLALDAFVYMTVVTLATRKMDSGHQIRRETVHDVIWALATPELSLQHVHVKASGNKLDIVLFVNSPSSAAARSAGLGVCMRACRVSAVLQDWEICG